jgi:hypothetical protein
MISFKFRFPVFFLRSLGVILLTTSLYHPGAASASDTMAGDPRDFAIDCGVSMGPIDAYDGGRRPAVAAHFSGLIVAVDGGASTPTDPDIWYRIGTLDGPARKVTWGAPNRAGMVGYNPSVVISKEGYVIVAYSDQQTKNGTELYYRVGKIDTYGTQEQTIHWLTPSMYWDLGFNQTMAINDNGVIVGVHESALQSDGMYYWVGRLADPVGGRFHIEWQVLQGTYFDTGIDPAIAINNRNEVVAVYQVPNESLLDYRRGVINGGVIEFAESWRDYEPGRQPGVILLDSGQVMEVYVHGGLLTRTGRLSGSDPREIHWTPTVIQVRRDSVDDAALAFNGTYAIIPFQDSGFQYSVAEFCQSGPALCDLEISAENFVDIGRDPAIAAHTSGLVIEFHASAFITSKMIYRVGTIDETRAHVNWGVSRDADVAGFKPTVAITREGYVILAYSSQSNKILSDLFYRIGKIDPDGGRDQAIEWLRPAVNWDAGFHHSMAINDSGVVVQVHEAGRGGDGIYYRVGKLVINPGNDDYRIAWYGQWGNRYDTGINPAIAINNRNEVVAVHQVSNESLLHYRRGVVNGGVIEFGESMRYDNHAELPAVALLDSGLVVEVHSLGGLITRTGRLRPDNSAEIEWAEPLKAVGDSKITNVSVGISAGDAVIQYDAWRSQDAYEHGVYSAFAKLCEPEA